MKYLKSIAFIFSFVTYTTAHGEPIPEETAIKCASYYEILSVTGDLNDITSKKSSRAFYAFSKRLPGSKNQNSIAEELVKMRNEIPGKLTEEGISDFRKKYDPTCRENLFQAWCEAYGDITKDACIK